MGFYVYTILVYWPSETCHPMSYSIQSKADKPAV